MVSKVSSWGNHLGLLKTDIWLKVIKKIIGGVEERLHKRASEQPLDPLIYHQPHTFFQLLYQKIRNIHGRKIQLFSGATLAFIVLKYFGFLG